MAEHLEDTPMNETAADGWENDRTTFQRVYDLLVGTDDYRDAAAFADQAACSEAGARSALEQLSEMGIAQRREGRPVGYRRNDSYVTWKRIDSLAREYSPAELRSRVESLIAEDGAYQKRFGVPEPDAVSVEDVPVDDHEAHEERWADLSEWRTVRRDITVLRRAVQRAETRIDDEAQA
jgi:hypothetical protein